MRLENYQNASPDEKLAWLDSITMKTGLKYFGGKSQIGKYILNHLFNMTLQMKNDGKRPDIFIDAFTGGGKIALSVPYGWYDTVVINDLNYGVYSYYKYVKGDYVALIKMIDKIGEMINEDLFHVALFIRSWGDMEDKYKQNKELQKDFVLDDLSAAALTYWVTNCGFNGIIDPEISTYSLKYDKTGKKIETNSSVIERDAIARIIRNAHKNIPRLHEVFKTKNIIVENLDYKELIKKYNGLPYKDIRGEEQPAIEEYKTKNKLWYFDPPYHPYTLYGGKDAPYADSFTLDMAMELADILKGRKKKEYGSLEYFIKSDYDPKEALKRAKRVIKRCNEDPNYTNSQLDWYNKLLAENAKNPKNISKAFATLEKFPFCKICVGRFDKGSMTGEDIKAVGEEYIWCRGFSISYIKSTAQKNEEEQDLSKQNNN